MPRGAGTQTPCCGESKGPRLSPAKHLSKAPDGSPPMTPTDGAFGVVCSQYMRVAPLCQEGSHGGVGFLYPKIRATRSIRMSTAAPALLTHDYLSLPCRLVRDLRDSPLAIGIFCLVARRFLVAHEPIPLSAADICAYDGTVSRGAVLRALHRLVALGWLVEVKQRGRKTHYAPAWGYIKRVVRPWQMDAELLGRPRHVQALRLDRRLLDLGLGKLAPDP